MVVALRPFVTMAVDRCTFTNKSTTCKQGIFCFDMKTMLSMFNVYTIGNTTLIPTAQTSGGEVLLSSW